MYNRPKPSDTEEDILKFQEEFLRNKSNESLEPAAKVINMKKETAPQETGMVVDTNLQLANTFESIPDHINIGKIVEKSFVNSNPTSQNFFHKQGFPEAKKRDLTAQTSKGSIFSQQMKKLKSYAEPSHSNVKNKIDKCHQNFPQSSCILTGADKDVIHNENVAILEQMSTEEIMEEQKKILGTMDPAIVAFLKARRKNNIETRSLSIAEQNQAAENFNIENVETPYEILSAESSEKWLNFDTVESGKLAWMTDFNIPKYEKGATYEARFDFDGWILPFTLQMNESNRSLYHHGEEAGRPGYTLQELFQLCRSSVIQQKVVALNTISKILGLSQSGVYDNIIELPLEQIFFVVRFCLDDNTVSVLNASIKAIRNLFYYPIDETCLQNLLGFGLGQVQPILAIDNSEVDDDSTVNDQQLAEANLIKCLARTNILKRIRYIISTVKPPTETIIYCLEILIRLARDSEYIVKQLYQSEDLLSSITKHFVPVVTTDNLQSVYGSPLIQALKLLRILCSRNRNYAETLLNWYKIMDSLLSYLSRESFSTNSNGLQLQIESFHLWCVFVHYNLSLDYFKQFQPVLLRLLDYHVKNTNLSSSYCIQGHVSSLLVFLSNIFQQNGNAAVYLAILKDYAFWKWTAQFESLSELSCGKLQIISSLMYCFIPLFEKQLCNIENLETRIESMLDSHGFYIVTKNIQSCSNLLNDYEVHKSGANLNSVEAAAWDASDHIIPSMQTSSCLPYLTVLSKLVTFCSNNIKLKFLKHDNIMNYLKLLNSAPNFYLMSNWFTRIESQFIANMLRIAVAVQNDIDSSLFYEVAVKSLSIYNNEFKEDIMHILHHIVFSPSFYPCELLMNNLHINHTNDLLLQALNNLDSILSVYSSVLNIKPDRRDNLLININSGTIMPIDWIYSPIIFLYLNQQKTNQNISESEQINIVVNCLRWIYLYESYFPNLAKAINPTDRFCRLACTFLGSDNLFLEPEIHSLLEACLLHIIKNNEENINFNKPIQGLNNFQDFYTQLLEQYQGVSYGDVLFGNFILLPLIQRHDVKYRKTLWSEYAGIIQIFNVTSEQVMCPTELFLNPVETDLSLLKCYRRSLTMGLVRKHSFLYNIINHHLQCFLSKKKDNKECS